MGYLPYTDRLTCRTPWDVHLPYTDRLSQSVHRCTPTDSYTSVHRLPHRQPCPPYTVWYFCTLWTGTLVVDRWTLLNIPASYGLPWLPWPPEPAVPPYTVARGVLLAPPYVVGCPVVYRPVPTDQACLEATDVVHLRGLLIIIVYYRSVMASLAA